MELWEKAYLIHIAIIESNRGFLVKDWEGKRLVMYNGNWTVWSAICIGNQMISGAIWNEQGAFFQRLTKLHEPAGWVQFVVFEKINKCLFIPDYTRKIVWLRF